MMRHIPTTLDDSGDDRTDKRHRKGIVDVELERSLVIVVAIVRQDIQECSHKIEAFASNIGDLENGTDSLADELCGRLNCLLPVLNEDRNLPCSLRLENASELDDGLL